MILTFIQKMKLLFLVWLSVTSAQIDEWPTVEHLFEQYGSGYDMNLQDLCVPYRTNGNWEMIRETFLAALDHTETTNSIETAVIAERDKILEKRNQILELLEKLEKSPTTFEIVDITLIKGLSEFKTDIDNKYKHLQPNVGKLRDRIEANEMLFTRFNDYQNKLGEISNQILRVRMKMSNVFTLYDETYNRCAQFTEGQFMYFRGIARDTLEQLINDYLEERNYHLGTLNSYLSEELEEPDIFAEVTPIYDEYISLLSSYKNRFRKEKSSQLYTTYQDQDFIKTDYTSLYDRFSHTNDEIIEVNSRVGQLVSDFNSNTEKFVKSAEEYRTVKRTSNNVINLIEHYIRDEVAQHFESQLSQIDESIEKYSLETLNNADISSYIDASTKFTRQTVERSKSDMESFSSLKQNLNELKNSVNRINLLWSEQYFSLEELDLEAAIVEKMEIIKNIVKSIDFKQELDNLVNSLATYKTHLPQFEIIFESKNTVAGETVKNMETVISSMNDYIENGLAKDSTRIYLNRIYNLLDNTKHWNFDKNSSLSNDNNVTSSHLKYLDRFSMSQTALTTLYMNKLKKHISSNFENLIVPSIYSEAEIDLDSHFATLMERLEIHKDTALELKSQIGLIDDKMNKLIKLVNDENSFKALMIDDPILQDDIPENTNIELAPITTYEFKSPAIGQLFSVCQKLTHFTESLMNRLLYLESVTDQVDAETETESESEDGTTTNGKNDWFNKWVNQTNSQFKELDMILKQVTNYETLIEGSMDFISDKTQAEHQLLSTSHQQLLDNINNNTLLVEKKSNRLQQIVLLMEQYKQSIYQQNQGSNTTEIDQLFNRLTGYFTQTQNHIENNKELVSKLNKDISRISQKINSKKDQLEQQLSQLRTLLGELKVPTTDEDELRIANHTIYTMKYNEFKTVMDLFLKIRQRGAFDSEKFSGKYQPLTTYVSPKDLLQIEADVREFFFLKNNLKTPINSQNPQIKNLLKNNPIEIPLENLQTKTTPAPAINPSVVRIEIPILQHQSSVEDTSSVNYDTPNSPPLSVKADNTISQHQHQLLVEDTPAENITSQTKTPSVVSGETLILNEKTSEEDTPSVPNDTPSSPPLSVKADNTSSQQHQPLVEDTLTEINTPPLKIPSVVNSEDSITQDEFSDEDISLEIMGSPFRTPSVIETDSPINEDNSSVQDLLLKTIPARVNDPLISLAETTGSKTNSPEKDTLLETIHTSVDHPINKVDSIVEEILHNIESTSINPTVIKQEDPIILLDDSPEKDTPSVVISQPMTPPSIVNVSTPTSQGHPSTVKDTSSDTTPSQGNKPLVEQVVPVTDKLPESNTTPLKPTLVKDDVPPTLQEDSPVEMTLPKTTPAPVKTHLTENTDLSLNQDDLPIIDRLQEKNNTPATPSLVEKPDTPILLDTSLEIPLNLVNHHSDQKVDSQKQQKHSPEKKERTETNSAPVETFLPDNTDSQLKQHRPPVNAQPPGKTPTEAAPRLVEIPDTPISQVDSSTKVTNQNNHHTLLNPLLADKVVPLKKQEPSPPKDTHLEPNPISFNSPLADTKIPSILTDFFSENDSPSKTAGTSKVTSVDDAVVTQILQVQPETISTPRDTLSNDKIFHQIFQDQSKTTTTPVITSAEDSEVPEILQNSSKPIEIPKITPPEETVVTQILQDSSEFTGNPKIIPTDDIAVPQISKDNSHMKFPFLKNIAIPINPHLVKQTVPVSTRGQPSVKNPFLTNISPRLFPTFVSRENTPLNRDQSSMNDGHKRTNTIPINHLLNKFIQGKPQIPQDHSSVKRPNFESTTLSANPNLDKNENLPNNQEDALAKEKLSPNKSSPIIPPSVVKVNTPISQIHPSVKDTHSETTTPAPVNILVNIPVVEPVVPVTKEDHSSDKDAVARKDDSSNYPILTEKTNTQISPEGSSTKDIFSKTPSVRVNTPSIEPTDTEKDVLVKINAIPINTPVVEQVVPVTKQEDLSSKKEEFTRKNVTLANPALVEIKNDPIPLELPPMEDTLSKPTSVGMNDPLIENTDTEKDILPQINLTPIIPTLNEKTNIPTLSEGLPTENTSSKPTSVRANTPSIGKTDTKKDVLKQIKVVPIIPILADKTNPKISPEQSPKKDLIIETIPARVNTQPNKKTYTEKDTQPKKDTTLENPIVVENKNPKISQEQSASKDPIVEPTPVRVNAPSNEETDSQIDQDDISEPESTTSEETTSKPGSPKDGSAKNLFDTKFAILTAGVVICALVSVLIVGSIVYGINTMKSKANPDIFNKKFYYETDVSNFFFPTEEQVQTE